MKIYVLNEFENYSILFPFSSVSSFLHDNRTGKVSVRLKGGETTVIKAEHARAFTIAYTEWLERENSQNQV